MNNKEDEKKIIRRILANNRYAKAPENVSKKRFSIAAIRAAMEKRYMEEWMATPPGLYTDNEIWKQTFFSYL